MAGLDIKLQVETIRRVSSSAITGTYQVVGSPLANAARLVIFANNSTTLVTLSFDGVNDHIDIPAGGVVVLDIASDKQLTNEWWIAQNTQFWVKGTAGTGNFCITSFF